MMIEFLKHNQLDIMLFMSGICAILACLTIAMKTLSTKRRLILASLDLVVMDKKLDDLSRQMIERIDRRYRRYREDR